MIQRNQFHFRRPHTFRAVGDLDLLGKAGAHGIAECHNEGVYFGPVEIGSMEGAPCGVGCVEAGSNQVGICEIGVAHLRTAEGGEREDGLFGRESFQPGQGKRGPRELRRYRLGAGEVDIPLTSCSSISDSILTRPRPIA
jgi:hypothetical protein